MNARKNLSRVKTKSDMVVEEIISMVSQGKFEDGEKLPPEQYFVDYFGVSRVTIRESFKCLSVLGIIDIQQGKGTFVRKPDLETLMRPLFSTIVLNEFGIRQLYDARAFVEAGTAALAAASHTEQDISQLHELSRQMHVVMEEKDSARFSELDIAFHMKIGEISNNKILFSTYGTIKNVLDTYISTSNLSIDMVRTSVDYHDRIIAAIEKGDAEQAENVMKKHVIIARDDLISRLKKEGVPKYVNLGGEE